MVIREFFIDSEWEGWAGGVGRHPEPDRHDMGRLCPTGLLFFLKMPACTANRVAKRQKSHGVPQGLSLNRQVELSCIDNEKNPVSQEKIEIS